MADVTRRSGSSFFWAMRLLARPKREALFAIYAFCREVDDIADGDDSEAVKSDALEGWRAKIDSIFAGGVPSTPTAHALLSAIQSFGLKKEDFLAVIDGMEMDAADRVRMERMTDLETYCDRVACAVGRMCNRVFGLDGVAGERVALAIGQALQLTNILRDLDEDACRGRLYLPAEVLRAHGIEEMDPQAVMAHPRLDAVRAEISAVARRRFAEGRAALKECDRQRVRPAVVMMEVYRRQLDRLEAGNWGRSGRSVRLSRLEKLWVAIRYGLWGGLR